MKPFAALVLLYACAVLHAHAQPSAVFHAEAGPIADWAGTAKPQRFAIVVSGLPMRIDSLFGLEEVCLDIQHTKVSDLKIELMAPDGTSCWLANRNGGDYGRDYTATCLRMDGFRGHLFTGEAPFRGAFVPDGRLDYLNNGQNPNGTWQVIVQDLQAGNTGALLGLTLRFGHRPARAGGTLCALQAPATCACPDGTPNCTLLPDLIVSRRLSELQWEEYAPTDRTYPGQLRLAIATANIGDGPLETRGSNQWHCPTGPVPGPCTCADGTNARQLIRQVIYRKHGPTLDTFMVPAGTNYYDAKPGHDHYHADDWVAFSLCKPNRRQRDPRKWKVMGKGTKVSYCLFDSGVCTDANGLCTDGPATYGETSLRNYGLGHYAACEATLQGISVGGLDSYGITFEGQHITLNKRVKNGAYALVIIVDPMNRYRESNENNNVVVVPVVLKLRGH